MKIILDLTEPELKRIIFFLEDGLETFETVDQDEMDDVELLNKLLTQLTTHGQKE